MLRTGLSLLLLVFLLIAPSSSPAEDKDRLVRGTDARTPEKQRQGFRLPEGFSMQLFADESLLGGKPINMAFDARGRLWVSSTREYPYAVPKARWSDPQGTRAKDSKDTIRILEDTDGDGRADKVTVFADELNIPTGVLPYKNGCIAWSIPNIWYFEDTDGDGKCDQRKILFGPLGWERDTHGMISSLRLGLDGWVYATHGFSNTSHFEVRPENRKETADRADMADSREPASEAGQKASAQSAPSAQSARSARSAVKEAGLTLDLTSGSVFRFLPDGSRIEPWTSGQVNPFGLCWDSWGNLYSADCHSNPITQLIRGACYPSFGKPHDGLGFAPNMCEHAHGSTGLCGIIYIDGGVWGSEWDDHMFVGNCVTSRVNHDTITFTGSTPKANEAPDFITSDDPWFRPVDLQLGPDSALYVADFYNRIIGHYEVPLDHPGRDRERGRIWRVVREGFTGKLTECDLSKLSAPSLVKALASDNLTKRMFAASVLKKVCRDMPSKEVRSLLREGCITPRQIAAGVWVASQLIDSETHQPLSFIGNNEDDFVDVHLLLSQAEFIPAGRFQLMYTMSCLSPPGTPKPRTQVAACWALANAGTERSRIALLLVAAHTASQPEDTTLGHASLVAARTLLKDPHVFQDAAKMMSEQITLLSSPQKDQILQLSEEEKQESNKMVHAFVIVLRSLATSDSASWLLKEFTSVASTPEQRLQTLTYIARHLPADRDGDLATLAQRHFGDDLDTQLDLFSAIREGRSSLALQSRDDSTPPTSSALAAWSSELTARLLATLQSEPANDWHPVTPPTNVNPNPWHPQTRKCADGKKRAFLDSHPAPGTEKLTGTLRSAPFALPEKLTFWLAGHRGFPNAAPHEKNFVRLIDTETGEELARAYPPRHDTAQEITWSFPVTENGTRRTEHACLELVDGDTGTAYAWLAAGGFDPAVVTIPSDPLQRDKRIRMLARLSVGDTGGPSVGVTGSLPVTSESNHGQAARDTHRLAAGATAFLAALPDKAGFTPDTRASLAEFLAARSSDSVASLLVPLARDAELAPTVFAALDGPDATSDELSRAFRTLPFRTQAKLATALAGSVPGAERLLKLAAPAVLAEPLVASKLSALGDAAVTRRLKDLTASLPPQNEALSKLIADRLKSFDAAKADVSRGEQVYTTMCAVCHRIGVRGNLVGPQLDGIGARGAERLLEDILDPNRAVDPAFRLHMVKRKDGSIHAGLLRREEGDALVFADAAAQETRIPKAEIAGREESPFSLMPPGMGEALTEQQLHDLLAYLLARK